MLTLLTNAKIGPLVLKTADGKREKWQKILIRWLFLPFALAVDVMLNLYNETLYLSRTHCFFFGRLRFYVETVNSLSPNINTHVLLQIPLVVLVWEIGLNIKTLHLW